LIIWVERKEINKQVNQPVLCKILRANRTQLHSHF
jgi:hypothetical protein